MYNKIYEFRKVKIINNLEQSEWKETRSISCAGMEAGEGQKFFFSLRKLRTQKVFF
jgi:hypothetical protein